MAIKDLAVVENISGDYFVDQNCIACQVCVKLAPSMFKMNAMMENAFVYSLPKNQQNKELYWEAMDLCPVESIGGNR